MLLQVQLIRGEFASKEGFRCVWREQWIKFMASGLPGCVGARRPRDENKIGLGNLSRQIRIRSQKQ
jgi:hypothetical protein